MVLSLLPKPPRKIDTAFIHAELEARGIEVHRRTIQRDLVELSQVFPLVSDARAKPYGWRWAEDAVFHGGLPVPTSRPSPAREIEARLQGQPQALHAVLDHLRARCARFSSDLRDPSDAVVTVMLEDNLASRRILLAHADEIEVVTPLTLRNDIAARARRAATRHERQDAK